MSDAVALHRTPRERWALPGGSHDRVVTLMRIALPSAVGVLGAYLVMAPMTMTGDVSFVLDKNKVEVAKERMRLQTAVYRGEDGKGQPFQLTAGSAVQRSSSEPVVQIAELKALMQLKDGPAHVTAPHARYNLDTDVAQLQGPIAVDTANGYKLRTQNATLDLKNRRLHSDAPVTGNVPQGNFSGNQMSADLENDVVRLDGHARLRIVPRHAR